MPAAKPPAGPRPTLLAVAGLHLLGALAAFARTGADDVLPAADRDALIETAVFGGAVAAAFVVLGLLSPARPVACAALGLALYGGLFAVSAVRDPPALDAGLGVRLFVLAALAWALKVSLSRPAPPPAPPSLP